MTISMYKVSVPIFVQFLTAQSNVIDKVVAHIEAKKLDPNFFLNTRFFPDMYPYLRQVQQALRGQNVLLCAHGWFNRMMRPVLKAQGWREVEDQGDQYWSYRRYEKR